MHVDNFIVRLQWWLVERYASIEAWAALDPAQHSQLSGQVAGLPKQLVAEPVESLHFDLLLLRLQIPLLRTDSEFAVHCAA
jgi:type I restriction enzyme, R subunit